MSSGVGPAPAHVQRTLQRRPQGEAASLAEYSAFCRGIEALTGLDLLQYKRGQMERRVRAFAAKRGRPALPEYLALLRRDATALEELLDRVTINVSQLWRNPEQWQVLEQVVIPELAAAGRIRVWSAGCSYGAECYTVAAVCGRRAPEARVEVRGTDFDVRMLERARAGVFSAEDARSAPREMLARWFEEQPGGGWAARAELRRMVSFDRGDLLKMPITPASYDLVMCRNVVIYFNEDVRDALHARLAAALRPGGFLVIGSTERVTRAAEFGLEPVRPFTYRKA